jgi:hypothetical protein
MSIENDDLDLSQVDLSRPLIDQQTVRCRVADVKIEEKDGKKNFNVVVTTEGAATSKDGKTLQPGFKHNESILMTPTGGLTQEMINEKLARFQKATLGTQGRLLPLDQYVGKEVDVTFGVRDGKDGQFQTVKRWNATRS